MNRNVNYTKGLLVSDVNDSDSSGHIRCLGKRDWVTCPERRMHYYTIKFCNE